MNLARSTFYCQPIGQRLEEARIVEKIAEICVEYPRYGYRRVTAQLQREGLRVNHKKTLRIMHEQGFSVRPHRRYVATTDSNHDGPIFPNLARRLVPTGPNQLWVADLTYIAIGRGFAYLAIILDAWSRRVVGYAVGSYVDVRLGSSTERTATAAMWASRGSMRRSRGMRRVNMIAAPFSTSKAVQLNSGAPAQPKTRSRRGPRSDLAERGATSILAPQADCSATHASSHRPSHGSPNRRVWIA